jgi:hypothetical protein
MESRTPFPLSSSPSLVISAELLPELNGFNTQFMNVLRYNCLRGAKQRKQIRVYSPAFFTVLPTLKRLVAEELTIFWNARPCNLAEVYWRFGRKYCLNLHDRRVGQANIVTSACYLVVSRTL